MELKQTINQEQHDENRLATESAQFLYRSSISIFANTMTPKLPTPFLSCNNHPPPPCAIFSKQSEATRHGADPRSRLGRPLQSTPPIILIAGMATRDDDRMMMMREGGRAPRRRTAAKTQDLGVPFITHLVYLSFTRP